MRRQATRVVSVLLVVSLGGLAACSRSGSAAAPATSAVVVSKEAGVEPAADIVTAGLGFVATNVLAGIASFGGSQAAGFLMAALRGPDLTIQRLDAIDAELRQVTTRLDEVQQSIEAVQAELVGMQLNDTMVAMARYNAKVEAVYKDYYLPIITAAVDLQKLKDAGKDTTAAEATLADRQTDFKEAFISAGIVSVEASQHEYLMPNSGFQSVLAATGKEMMLKGFATAMDSTRMHRLYVSLADQEALAARLALEYHLMEGDVESFTTHAQDYEKNVAAEQANLPLPIPEGMILVGPSGSMTTAHLFMAPAGDANGTPWQARPWLPITPEGVQIGRNSGHEASFIADGWDLPTGAEMTALFDASKNATIPGVSSAGTLPGNERLGRLWSNGAQTDAEKAAAAELAGLWNQKVVWTKDLSASNPMSCWQNHPDEAYRDRVDRIYTLHRLAVLTGTTSLATQGQPGRIPDDVDWYDDEPSDLYVCDNALLSLYDNPTYAGGWFLTQPAMWDYMAQTAAPAATS